MLSKALAPELDKDFSVRGKILSIQGTLIMTVIPNLIISGLVSSGKISCNPLLPAKVVGEGIKYILNFVVGISTNSLIITKTPIILK